MKTEANSAVAIGEETGHSNAREMSRVCLFFEFHRTLDVRDSTCKAMLPYWLTIILLFSGYKAVSLRSRVNTSQPEFIDQKWSIQRNTNISRRCLCKLLSEFFLSPLD